MITLSATAQVPGYMGKRLSIGYSNYFMLSAYGPTANASSPEIGTIGLNTVHSFNLEYSIKNRTNVCLSVQSGKTGMNPPEESAQYYDGTSNYNYYTYHYAPRPYKPMQISSLNVGLGVKFFQSGSLAPIGKYRKLELLLLFNHLTYKRDGFTYYDYNNQQYRNLQVGKGDYRYKTFAITYTIGRSRVLFDRLVLDGGIRFGLMPAAIFNFLNDGEIFFDAIGSTSTEATFKHQVNNRLFRAQTFNFHLGLSFLAF